MELGLFVCLRFLGGACFAKVRNNEEDERHEGREENWLQNVVFNGIGKVGVRKDEAREKIEEWPEDEAKD